MIAVPAIDILDGRVTRVNQGKEDTAKFYSGDPVETAISFFQMGAKLVHVVDLDAALHGEEKNVKLIERMISTISSMRHMIQLGGGIRSRSRAEQLLARGTSRIVLSSLAYTDPDSVLGLQEEYGSERIVLALDYDESQRVRTLGWKNQITETVNEAFVRFLSLGFKTFLLTSVKRDGMLEGPDFETLTMIAQADLSSRIIASGGISSIEDLERLEEIGVKEAIIGKAIYEQRISNLGILFQRFGE